MEENKTFTCDLCDVKILDKISWEAHIAGKKHTKAVEWLNRKEETRSQGIFVRGFPPWSKPDQLKHFFSQFGEIKDFIPGGKRTPFVIVQFVDRTSAQNCLSRQLYFYGWRLNISQRKVNEDISPTKKRAANEDVKKVLDHTHVLSVLPSCDSFEAQLAALIHELELTDTDKFAVICKNLETTFSGTYPGCKAHPFGSSVTGLALKGSDMDVFMDLNLESSDEEIQATLVYKARKLLYRFQHYYTNIIAIAKAKTPIVKFVHSPTATSCDLSFKNALGVHNSALIRYYLSLDERLKPLLMLIKYWAKKNEISGTGRLSHYALVMLVVFYLQQLSPPIVPTVYSIRSNSIVVDGWECSFDANAWSPGEEKNTMTIPELIIGFFKFCSIFEYGLKVICPLIGESVAKALFEIPEQLPKAMDQYKSAVSKGFKGLRVEADVCIQDPYELTHNLAGTMTLKKLEEFKSYCAEVANVLSTLECDSLFLRKLFDKINISSTTQQKKKISLIRIPLRKAQVCNIVEEDELREWWFKAVFNFVLKILEQVLKCTLKVENDVGQSVRKIQKRDGQTDVGNKCTEDKVSDEKRIHCCGKCRVWDGRKDAAKHVEFVEDVDSDPIVREILLSDYLMHKQVGGSMMKFSCIFRAKQDPTEVELELFNEECNRGDFFSVCAFLQRRLARWVEVGLKQHKHTVQI